VSLFATKTEESFFNFFNDRGRLIRKIELENSPDFIVDGQFLFEVKEINSSGTAIVISGLTIQKINVINVINKYLIDANKKINNYRKLQQEKSIFALVIYNSRYFTWDKVRDAFSSCDIEKYSNINNLIYAGYNKPSNQTRALHIFKNKSSGVNMDISVFKNLNVKIY